MNVQITPIDYENPTHRDAIVPLLESYAGTPESCGRGMTDDARARVVGLLRENPKALVLLAWRGEEPVGLAVCFEGLTTFKAQPVINIHDVVVAPSVRGQGIGGKLIEAIEAEARRRNAYSLTLEVVGNNDRAKRLYSRMGFEGGQSIDPPEQELFWRKTLQY